MRKLADYDVEKRKTGKTSMFLIRNPTRELAAKLYQTSAVQINPGPDYVTPQALHTFFILVDIASEFLATNTYPAWLSKESKDQHQEADLFFAHTVDTATSAIPSVSYFPRKEDAEEEEDEQEEIEVDEESVEIRRLTFGDLREAVLVAKPSPLPLSYNTGPPAEVPSLPGLAFPYFDRMNIPDLTTIRSILSKFFFRCLGATSTEQMQQFRSMKVPLEHLVKTSQGGVLAHIFVGIQLALETQTRLYVVMRGSDYCGFILLGACFRVIIDNLEYGWVDPESLQKEVAKMSAHAWAIEELAKLLSGCKLDATKRTRAVTVESLSSSLKLWDAIEARVFDADTGDKISERLGLVSFTRSYMEVNAENIAWALRMMTIDQAKPLEDPQPLYVSPLFKLYGDRIFKVLCCFGPDSFSFINASGSTFHIGEVFDKDPNNKLDNRGNRALPIILVARKSVQVAYQDMRRVLKEGSIIIDLKERAGKNRCLVMQGARRDAVYKALSSAIHEFQGAGSKRKNGGDEAPAAKKARTADDILDEF
jgi:hypothetical protein